MQDKNMNQSVNFAKKVQQQFKKAGRVDKGVHQAGSSQDSERTRFDFSYGQAMTADEIAKVEAIEHQPSRYHGLEQVEDCEYYIVPYK